MKVLAVVPARGGSKRIPLKNIAPLAGKPLLAYTLEAIRDAGLFDNAVVSTDDAKIAGVAADFGISCIERPSELGGDSVSTEAVLLDAIKQWCGKDSEPSVEWVMTLPPTSPLRSAKTIRLFASMVDSDNIATDCFMSVTEDRGDYWRFNDKGVFCRLFPDAPRRQQDRMPLFEENSAIYVTRVAALQLTGSILGESVKGVPIQKFEGFDINDPEDLLIASALMQQLQTKKTAVFD